MVVVVFFCKQKTAYEMRISDWSSDVLFRSCLFRLHGRRRGSTVKLPARRAPQERPDPKGRRGKFMQVRKLTIRRLELPLTVPYRLSLGDIRTFEPVLVEAGDGHGAAGFGQATLLTGYTDETGARRRTRDPARAGGGGRRAGGAQQLA